MSLVDHPYIDPESGEEIVPVVQVRINGRMVAVSQEVVGRGAVRREFGLLPGTAVYRERHGKRMGNPLDGPGHVFHAGDRYVAVCLATGLPVKVGREEPV